AVRADGAKSHLVAAWILEDQLDVIEDIAPVVFPRIQATEAHHKFWLGAEHPVGHIHLMRSQLGGQPARELAEQPPVPRIALPSRPHHPAGISMPHGVDMRDVSENSLLHHLPGGLEIMAIPPL